MEWLRKNHLLLTTISGILVYLLMGAYQVGAFKASTDATNAKLDDLANRVTRIESVLMRH